MFIFWCQSTEFQVEKRHKQLQDWRSTEAKAKAKSYAATKDNEKCQVGLWCTQVWMARVHMLSFRTNFLIASLGGGGSSVIRSRSSCRWSILQMIITIRNSIINKFKTNMHNRPNGRKARQQCGKATWNTTLRASRPREAGWIGRGRSRGEPRWWHGLDQIITITSIKSNLRASSIPPSS